MGLISRRGEHDEDDQSGQLHLSGLDHLERPDELVYEVDDWSERGRVLLRERLETLAVPHQWETEVTLVVAAADEAWVERIMDQVEDDLSLSVDPDVAQVAYDLGGWDEENRGLLFGSLEDEAVPFAMEGDELHVHEIDEQRVDELIEALLQPDASPEPSADLPDVMGELFVAADRLARDPAGPDGTISLRRALDMAAVTAPPYGMDAEWWDDVLAQGRTVLDRMAADDHDHTEIVELATELRSTLRPYV